MFDSFYQIDEQIRRERERAITRSINGFARWDRQNISGNGIKALSQQLLDDYNDGYTVDKVKKIFAECGYNSDFIGVQEYEIILKVLKDISNVSDDEVKNNILKARFMAEFGGQIKNVNYNSNEASIELFVRDKKIKVDINGSVKIASGVSLLWC